MKKKIHLWSAFLGNLFEHYDTALFGLLSPFLSPLLFPGHEPLTALILTYAIIPLGMFARPFGSLVFGYIGDVYGRKQALFLTLAGMAIVSGGIALTPLSFPLIFCLGRLLQNFFASGETMGGAIFLLENTPEKKTRSVERPIQRLDDWRHTVSLGRRFPLKRLRHGRAPLAPALRGGLFDGALRLPNPANPAYRGVLRVSAPILQLKTNILDVPETPFHHRHQFRALVRQLLDRSGLNERIHPSSVDPDESRDDQPEHLAASPRFLRPPLFGWLASKISREKMMLTASLCLSLGALPLFVALEGATLTTVIAIRMCFVLLGVAYSAPFHAFAQQLIPKAHRYAVISFGYAIGSQALGGPTTALSLWLYKSTGLAAAGALFIVVLAALNCFVLLFTLQNTSQKITNPLP